MVTVNMVTFCLSHYCDNVQDTKTVTQFNIVFVSKYELTKATDYFLTKASKSGGDIQKNVLDVG